MDTRQNGIQQLLTDFYKGRCRRDLAAIKKGTQAASNRNRRMPLTVTVLLFLRFTGWKYI